MQHPKDPIQSIKDQISQDAIGGQMLAIQNGVLASGEREQDYQRRLVEVASIATEAIEALAAAGRSKQAREFAERLEDACTFGGRS